MKILGIDPGIGRLGWGVVEVQSSKFKVQSYGCLETPKEYSIGDRLVQIHDFLEGLLVKEKVDGAGIEELFFSNNAKTAFAVGQARGIVLYLLAKHQIPIGIYTPLQVKIAVTGYGKAEKTQVGQMVKTILKLQSVPKPDDTADALAIALTHAFSRPKMK